MVEKLTKLMENEETNNWVHRGVCEIKNWSLVEIILSF